MYSNIQKVQAGPRSGAGYGDKNVSAYSTPSHTNEAVKSKIIVRSNTYSMT